MIHRDIGLAGIAIPGDRMRALRASKVQEIAESFKATGQLQPIVVCPKALGFALIAGRHRLEAARQLKWEAIACVIVEGKSADERALMEIDENLIRAELSPAEVAAHVGARKAIYERLHPESRSVRVRGGPGRGKKNHGQIGRSFADETAKKTGKPARTIRREAARNEAIPDVADLAYSSLDSGEELDALSRLYEADTNAAETLVQRAKNGEKVSARHALKGSARAIREKNLGAKIIALPQCRYGVILADPEWRFEPWSRETGMDRAADNHYPTSATEVIAARPMADIAADSCALFLWATVPMLPQALEVMAAWGFKYKSQFVWVKNRTGKGYWNRNAHEMLLLGTRGSMITAPAPGHQWDSVIEAPVGRHSEKPEVFYELIESYFPTLPKIELNARKGRPGWSRWGLEAPAEAAE